MSALSAIKAALKIPNTGHKSRWRQQVITFKEALEDLKTSPTGFVICAAFHSFGRCRKEISLPESDFLANLDRLDLTDIQSPISLMPLMLCSKHWGKTVYYNALFLDWLSVYGSKKAHPQFENTVVDYQSAIVIDNRESSEPEIATSSRSTSDAQGRPTSAPDSSNRDQNYLETLTRVAQVQINSDHEPPDLSETEPDCAAQNLPNISVLVGMESYASIELGVAHLEILYQEHLKCVAMTLDGWRCPEIIHKEQQRRVQELLSSYTTAGSELDMEIIPRLVLCPGHSIGELPRIYSEKWAAFSNQRLSKEEAMSKFNTDFWLSVEFFSNEERYDDTFQTASSNRLRSDSHLSSRSADRYHIGITENAGGNSQTPRVISPLKSVRPKFEFSFRDHHLPNSQFGAKSSLRDVFERESLSAKMLKTECQPQSVPEPVPISARPVDRTPVSEIIALSASGQVAEEAISPGKTTVAQDSRLEIPAVLLSSYGAISKNSRHLSQEIIDKNLITEMNALPLKGGYVRIYWSPSRKLCKVGKATDINTRKQQTQVGCLLQYFDQVMVLSKFTTFPERVTKLVQLELQNFRAKLGCEGCHHPEFKDDAVQSEHGEWFDITEEVAISSVSRWCDFTCRAYTCDATIKKEWAEILTLLPTPKPSETGLLERVLEGGSVPLVEVYHLVRSNRYNEWILGLST